MWWGDPLERALTYTVLLYAQPDRLGTPCAVRPGIL